MFAVAVAVAGAYTVKRIIRNRTKRNAAVIIQKNVRMWQAKKKKFKKKIENYNHKKTDESIEDQKQVDAELAADAIFLQELRTTVKSGKRRMRVYYH